MLDRVRASGDRFVSASSGSHDVRVLRAVLVDGKDQKLVRRARVDDVVTRYPLFHLAGVAMALAEEITRGVSRINEIDAGLYETKSFGGTHETVVVRVRDRRT
jgi:hypothetical protein